MSGMTLTGDQYDKFQKLLEKEEKQKKALQRLNAKVTLQAKWAKLHGCPVDTKHAEYYLGLPEHLRETMTVDQIISAVEEANA